MHSMTGFGRGVASRDRVTVTVELSAVNRKQLDVRVNLPRAVSVLEPKVVKIVRNAVARGGITVAVRLDEQAATTQSLPVLDPACADAYMQAADTLTQRYGLPDPVRVADLLRMPGVMTLTSGAEEDPRQVWPVLQEALQQALEELRKMRATEGRALYRDARSRLRRLQRLHDHVARRAPRTVEQYRTTLQTRIQGLELEAGPELDTALAREVALVADRCDIAEELVRLESHIAQGTALLEEQKKPVGRTLDFLCQELLREMNTIGSKANDATIAKDVVEMKTQLEGLREQVQNLE